MQSNFHNCCELQFALATPGFSRLDIVKTDNNRAKCWIAVKWVIAMGVCCVCVTMMIIMNTAKLWYDKKNAKKL